MSFECDFQKLVCTTIQPTELPFGELYDWYGAADFVADYLNFIPLEPPHELVSSFTCFQLVFIRQKRLNNSTYCAHKARSISECKAQLWLAAEWNVWGRASLHVSGRGLGDSAITFSKIHVKIHTDSTVDYSKQPKRESHHFGKPAACTNRYLCRVFSRHVCCRRHLYCGYSKVTASSTAQCLRLYWSASAMTLTSSAATLRRKLVWWMRLERPVLWCSQFPR